MNVQNIIAVQGHIEEAGAIVWWRLNGGLNHVDLAETWKALGLKEELLPTIPSLESCLRRVVQGHQRKHYRARPTKVGWVFIEEMEAETGDDLMHRTDLKVRIEGDVVVCDPPAHSLSVALQAETNFQRSELAAQDAGSWLVSLVRRLEAVPLRDGGGVYFIPRGNLEIWHAMVGAVRKVSAHTISEVRALKSDEAVAAITDAINRDAEQVFKTISDEIQAHMSGEAPLGERAVETRQQKLRDLSTKLETYERLLGTRLGAMRDRMEQVVGALALGHLATSGGL